MTTVRTLLLGIGMCLFALPAVAQGVSAPAVQVPEIEEDGLSGSVTDENAWQDLSIAIPSFATDRDQPTAANSQGTTALGIELGRVVYNDLRNNGLFRPVGPDSLPNPAYQQITAPSWSTWSGRSAEMLVQGYVRAGADGRLTVGCYLYDVQLQQQLVREGWVVDAADWRRAAHIALRRPCLFASFGRKPVLRQQDRLHRGDWSEG
jgi:TolB protein